MDKELFEQELQNTSINDVSLADYIKENYVPIEVLGKIRAEIIEQISSELTADGRRMVRRESVLQIIDKYITKSKE